MCSNRVVHAQSAARAAQVTHDEDGNGESSSLLQHPHNTAHIRQQIEHSRPSESGAPAHNKYALAISRPDTVRVSSISCSKPAKSVTHKMYNTVKSRLQCGAGQYEKLFSSACKRGDCLEFRSFCCVHKDASAACE